jgi:hypothetical protein
MLLTPDSLGRRLERNVTADVTAGEGAALEVTFYANARGCGTPEANAHQIFAVEDALPWSQIRFRQRFAGLASCYSVLGATERIYSPEGPNLHPYDPRLDTVFEEQRMSFDGDAFPGAIDLCEATPRHFWSREDPEPRSIGVILRRNDPDRPAGPGTGVACNTFGEGTGSPTWWRYEELYVR